MKRQWRILQIPPEYSMEVQACLPAALCALHNFICKHDPDMFDHEFDGVPLDDEFDIARGELGDGPADPAERRRADQRRDAITSAMREDYLAERTRRGLPLPG